MKSESHRQKLQVWFPETISESLSKRIEQSVHLIAKALSQFNADKGELGISFNGGKDCTVVLYLYILTLAALQAGREIRDEGGIQGGVFLKENQSLKALRVLYFEHPAQFEEQRAFVEALQKRYSLSIEKHDSGKAKQALQTMVQESNLKAILMGNRRTDPHSDKLNQFEPSSEGWPKFMRIFPILEWKYAQVWEFLRLLKLPYCSLYDQGYTSISLKHNSPKNELLKQENGEYLPAYLLQDGDENERKERGSDSSFK